MPLPSRLGVAPAPREGETVMDAWVVLDLIRGAEMSYQLITPGKRKGNPLYLSEQPTRSVSETLRSL